MHGVRPDNDVTSQLSSNPQSYQVGTRLEENKDVKESFTMWFVADKINTRIFLWPMIYSTVSARLIAQLNMSFIQYLQFWNCRYIAQYWKPFINRLWHSKWRRERKFDLSKSSSFPRMHQVLVHQETVASNVCMTCSRESTCSTKQQRSQEVWGSGLTVWRCHHGNHNETLLGLWLNWHESQPCFCFFSTHWHSMLFFCLFMLEIKYLLWNKLGATNHYFPLCLLAKFYGDLFSTLLRA